MTAIPSPVPYFTDLDGAPLDGGYIYVGTAGMDARTNPISVFWDSALTIPAPQPIRTVNGYPLYQGRPTPFFIAVGSASVTVLQSNGVAVITNAEFIDTATDFITDLAASTGSGLVGFSFSNTYADGTVGKALDGGVRTVMAAPYNADCDNVANDSAAIQAAIADGVAVTPDHLVKMDTAITGDFRALALGTQFTGANPIDGQYPAFGPGVLRTIARGASNSLIGITHNTATAATVAFPTGVTCYGRNDNAGNHVFGIYAEGRQYASTGVATNEIDSFNHTAAPSANLPPDLSIGTAQNHAIGLQVGAGGDFNSSIGIHICREGSSPQRFLTGIYVNPDACVTYGLFVDSTSTSTQLSALVKHPVGQIGFQLQGVGTPVAANAAFIHYDGNSVERNAIKQNGDFFINGSQILTSRQTGWTAASGAASKATFDTATVTTAQLAQRVKSLIDDLMTHGVIGT